MVELIFGAVGGHIGHVEAVAGTTAAHHGGIALVQFQSHSAVHSLLGAIHEAIKRILKRAVPKALIHQIRPLLLELAFGAQHIGRQGEALQLLVGLDQQQ